MGRTTSALKKCRAQVLASVKRSGLPVAVLASRAVDVRVSAWLRRGHRLTRIASFFTDDATFWLARGPEPVGRTLKGKETIRKTLADRFKVIPDMRWDHKEYIYAGNRAISIWTVRGKGADGEDLNYQGCDIYTFRGGKICAKDTYWKIVEHKDRL